MTVLVQANSKSYNPQTTDLPFTVDVNATQILVTFTHANTLTAWPDGVLVQYEVLWGGVSNGISQTSGGVFHDKSGNLIAGNIETTFGTYKPPGFTSGVARVTVVQRLTTAILVESF